MQSNTAGVYVRARSAGGFREKLPRVPFLGVFKGMPGLTVTRAIALNLALLEPRTSRSNRMHLLREARFVKICSLVLELFVGGNIEIG